MLHAHCFSLVSCSWAAMSLAAGPQMLPRPWAPPVPLQRVVVVAPEEAAALRLAGALRNAGADVEVMTPETALAENGLDWRPAVAARTVVLVGGIHVNRALLPLYAGYLALGDAAYPGPGGYVVRTICRPFGPDTAAVAVEASDGEGTRAGVSRLVELIEAHPGALPATLEARLAGAALARARQAPDPGMRYLLTGDAAEAQPAVTRLLAAVTPGQGFAPHGDYGIERWVREYNHIQDAPGVTAEQVLQLDQALLLTSLSTATEYWRRHDGQIIGGRHQTMGTSAITAVIHLLRRRGAADLEAATLLDQWWNECLAFWRHATSTFHDDLEGIPSYYCPEPTLDWALQLGAAEYVRTQLPLAVLRAYAVVDNLGFYAGTGTYEECRPGDVYKPVPWQWLLQAAAYFHPQRGFDELCRAMGSAGGPLGTWGVGRCFGGARTFAADSEPRSADPAAAASFLGLVPVPLGAHRYASCSHDPAAARAAGQRYLTAPLERGFEKLCGRADFTPDGQYFVIEGFQTALADNLPPLDANALIRYTDLGHVWLYSNTEKQGNLFRSAVFCSDGVNDSPQPAGCDLQACYSGPQLGLAASLLPDYGACDWTRNLIWRRGHYLVLIDVLRQTRPGRFNLICTFRTPQRAWLEPDGMLAREGTAEMHLRVADSATLSLDTADGLEGAAVPTLLRQTQFLDGQPGEVRSFRSLIYATDPTHPGALEIRPLDRTAAVVRGTSRGSEELALVAAAATGAGLKVGPYETDGYVLYVGRSGWAQAGGTGIAYGGTRALGNDGAATPEMVAAIEQLWAGARPAAPVAGAENGRTAAEPVWNYAGFTHVPPGVAAPQITSAPPPAAGLLGSLLDGVVTCWPTVRWPAGTVELTLDWRESQPLARIDFQTGLHGSLNTIPDPAGLPPPRLVVAECSDDGFTTDRRRLELSFSSDCTFEGLHKGSVFPILRWTCRDLQPQKARSLRLTFPSEAWREPLGLSELSVRIEGRSPTRVCGWCQRDVDGDGHPEVLAWTDQAELVALRANGTRLWQRQFGGFITAAEAYPDLGPDGPRTLVTTREARLYCLRPDGSEAWRTDFLASGKLNTDLPTGYSIGLLERPDRSRLIVVGCYNLASFVSPDGEVLKFERLPAAYQTLTLTRGFDYDGDGKQDLVSTEVWGCLSVLDTDLRRRAGGRLPRGRGIRLEYWLPPTPEQSQALICTENGVGLLDLKTLKYAWLREVKPVSGCAVGDINGDGRREVILAKEDGWLLALDDAGQTVRSELVAGPVRAVAAVAAAEGRTLLALGLADRVELLDPAGPGRAMLARGEFTHLEPGPRPGLLLAAAKPAAVVAFDLASVRLDRGAR